MNYSLLLYSISALLFLSSCHRGTGETDRSANSEADVVREVIGEIVLSREQFESMEMEIGDPSPMKFSNAISANGYIVATPAGSAKISTLISGRVSQINHSIGDQIKKGQILFSLEGNEIILLQQEYGEAFHQLHLLEADYQRLKLLSEEKVVAQKDFLKAESEYRIMLSKVMGLKARLKMVGIDPAQVENGKLVPFLSVISPIQGTITKQELVLGQFVEPQETVVEIVDNEKMQIRLQVFEKDLATLAIGQQVQFYIPDKSDMEFKALLSHIGISIDPDTRVIHCLAKIDPADQGTFTNNLFVESRILTCQREAMAIPELALIREAERNYLLVLKEENEDRLIFRKIPVQTGVIRQGYAEVLDNNIKGILLKGAYNLWTEE